MPSFVVRPAVPEDAADAVTVLRASITELCVADHQNDIASLERWLRNKTVENFRAWVADSSNFVVVAEELGLLCGVGLLARSGDLNLCYLRPGWQRRGIGSAILTALEERARAWGLPEVRLFSALGSRDFYERHEYVSDGEPRPAYGFVQDIPYRKRLTR
jgi:GNAT superfamily N-acetyltransferase